MFGFFKKVSHPERGRAYAITAGDYVGEMLVFVEEKEDYGFLSLPEMVVRSVPKDKFHFGMENKIVEDVKKIPDKFFTLIAEQYKQNSSVKA